MIAMKIFKMYVDQNIRIQ